MSAPISRRLALTLPAAALLAGSDPAMAASYPDRTISLIVPYGTGGGTDTTARIVAPKLAEILKTTVVVVNKPGAGSIIGSEYVERARPDGYTILYGADDMVIDRSLYSNLPFDSEKDFAPITDTFSYPLFVIVKGDSPIKTIHELTAYIKANPAKANYASAAAIFWLTTELFLQRTGTHATRVPYKGAGGMALAVASGEVLFAIPSPPPVIGQSRGGAIRILATTAPKRLAAFPDIPTMEEAGVPNLVITSWHAMWAPAKTPPAILETLNSAMRKVLAMPELQAQAKRLNVTPISDTIATFKKKLAYETALWKSVAEKAHISIKL